jgi:hypothetical protein
VTVKDNVIIGIFVLLFLYLFPFLMSPFVQVGSLLWGFIVGRRRRFALIDPRIPTPNPAQSKADDAQDLVDHEFQYLETARQEKADIVKDKLREIKERKGNIRQEHEKHKAALLEALPARAFRSVKALINRETGKNVLLFIGIVGLLFVDTLIARQIFVSLGLFVSDNIVFLEHEIQYTVIYGVFLTLTLAILLHLVWPREAFKSFVSKRKWNIVIGAAALVVFFLVRLLTVLFPDTAQRYMEVLMLLCWIIGVVGVYWLIGEIVNDEEDWFKLLVATVAPLVIVLLVFFGSIVIVHGLLELIFTKTFEAWFELRQARAVRQERNTLEASYGMKRGFYRGFTL